MRPALQREPPQGARTPAPPLLRRPPGAWPRAGRRGPAPPADRWGHWVPAVVQGPPNSSCPALRTGRALGTLRPVQVRVRWGRKAPNQSGACRRQHRGRRAGAAPGRAPCRATPKLCWAQVSGPYKRLDGRAELIADACQGCKCLCCNSSGHHPAALCWAKAPPLTPGGTWPSGLRSPLLALPHLQEYLGCAAATFGWRKGN